MSLVLAVSVFGVRRLCWLRCIAVCCCIVCEPVGVASLGVECSSAETCSGSLGDRSLLGRPAAGRRPATAGDPPFRLARMANLPLSDVVRDVDMELEEPGVFLPDARLTPARGGGSKGSGSRRKLSSKSLLADTSGESIEEKETKRLRSCSNSRSDAGTGVDSVVVGSEVSDMPVSSITRLCPLDSATPVGVVEDDRVRFISRKYQELISNRYKPNCVGPYCVWNDIGRRKPRNLVT